MMEYTLPFHMLFIIKISISARILFAQHMLQKTISTEGWKSYFGRDYVQKEAWQALHSLLKHHLYLPPTLNDSEILAHELYKLALFQLKALCQTLLISQRNAKEERRKALLCVHVRPSHPSLQMQEKESPLPTHVPPFMQGFGIQLLFLALEKEKVISSGYVNNTILNSI